MIRLSALIVTSLAMFPAARWEPVGFICLVVAGLALAFSWAVRDEDTQG